MTNPKKKTASTPLAIDKNTNLGDLVANYPHLAKVLMEDYGLHCVGCMASAFDTLEQGAKIHGMNSQAIQAMVKRLNQLR